MSQGPRGSELTLTLSSTTYSQRVAVVQKTYDVLSDPCDYLVTQLSSRIRSELGAPSSATISCSLLSTSLLSDSRREYSWDVTVSWVE